MDKIDEEHAARCRETAGPSVAFHKMLSCAGVALCLAFSPMDARGQDNTVVSRRAECPDFMAKDLRKPMISLVPDLQFYRQENGDEPTSISAKFREPLAGPFNVDRARSDDRPSDAVRRYLVRMNRGSGQLFCGWVDATSVLVGAEPIRASDIDPTDQVETRRGHFVKNPLHLKVLLRSNPEVMPRGATNWDPRSVPLFESPNDAAPYKTINIFAVFRAYQVRRDAKTGKPLWYYITGDNPYSTEYTAGWVKRESVFEWTNRVALYFSPDQSAGDGVIYGTRLAAMEKNQTIALARRSTTAVEPRGRNIARFPILDRQNIAGNTSIYEIAMFGDATIGEAPARSQPCRPGDPSCVSSTDVINAIGIAGELAKKSANMDILFVVDNTRSMRAYVKNTITGVKDAAERIRAEQKGQVRFAGALYGDYKSPQDLSPQNMQFKLNNFLVNQNLSSIEAMTREPEYTEDGMRDLPEAGLAALVRAIKDAGWSRDAGVKMVFWIGDHGSRAVGDRENVGVEHVIAALKSAGIAFFVPINVYGDYSQTFNKRFIDQAEAISDFGRGEGGKFKVMTTYDNASKSDTAKRVADSIYLGYEAALGVGSKLRNLGVGDGATAPPEKSAPAVVPSPPSGETVRRTVETNVPVAEMTEGDLVERILRMHGLSVEAINRYRKARQLMTYGHVNVGAGSREFNYWITLEKKDMGQLHTFIDNLCKLLDNQDVTKTFNKLLLRLTETFGGDDYDPSESVADFLTRQLFIPKEHFSTVLSKTPTELSDWWRSHTTGTDTQRNEAYEFRRVICRSAYLFNNVMSSRRIEPEDIEAGDEFGKSWRPRNGQAIREYNWMYQMANNNEYFYVPISYFPRDPDSPGARQPGGQQPSQPLPKRSQPGSALPDNRPG